MLSFILTKKISEEQKNNLSGEMIKVVVDAEKEILSIGCELHLDCAEQLAENGSSQANLWGANFYPVDGAIDFVSLINIRPAVNNRSMEIQDASLKQKVESVIRKLLW